MILPESGELYVHTSGRVYEVLAIANKNSTRPKEFPVSIVYQNTITGEIWVRPVRRWLKTMVKDDG